MCRTPKYSGKRLPTACGGGLCFWHWWRQWRRAWLPSAIWARSGRKYEQAERAQPLHTSGAAEAASGCLGARGCGADGGCSGDDAGAGADSECVCVSGARVDGCAYRSAGGAGADGGIRAGGAGGAAYPAAVGGGGGGGTAGAGAAADHVCGAGERRQRSFYRVAGGGYFEGDAGRCAGGVGAEWAAVGAVGCGDWVPGGAGVDDCRGAGVCGVWSFAVVDGAEEGCGSAV